MLRYKGKNDMIAELTPIGVMRKRSISDAKPSPGGVCPHCGRSLRGEGKGVYRLSRLRGLWELVFDGKVAQFKHEKGAGYVARLLNEPLPIHALDLTGKSRGWTSDARVSAQKRRSEASLREVIEIGGIVQERCASLDDTEARQALIERRRQLEAVVTDPKAPFLKREQARLDIQAIAKFLRASPRRPPNNAQRAARAVRMAIKRFHHNLGTAVDERGKRDRVLTAFAEHLKHHLLTPSARFSSPKARQARGELTGSFVYERPATVVWRLAGEF
jgi:hypothetical protein